MVLKTIGNPIITGVSARHLHLSEKDLETLFGKGHSLTPMKDLRQPGQFACEEKVAVVGPKGRFDSVRVLGPTRKMTQVEVSMTDAMKLGVVPPVRDSGQLEGSPGVRIIGPVGSVDLEQGLIAAKRHIHMVPEDAARYGVKDKELVSVVCEKEGRKLVFQDVLIRVNPTFALEFHVDTDEANAALLQTGDMVSIVRE